MKEMATHTSIFAWEFAWTEELGGLQSMGYKESDTTEHACARVMNIKVLKFHLSLSLLLYSIL